MTPTIRRRLINRGVLPKPQEPEESHNEEETPSAEVSTPAVPRRIKKRDDKVENDHVIVDKKFKAKKSGKNPVEDIIEVLRKGEALMIRKDGISSYIVSIVPNEVIVSKTFNNILKKGIIGKQYWEEVLSPEFTEWISKWNAMTVTEKYEYAEKHAIVWKHSDEQKIDIMSLTEAARAAAGVQKYKPEYQSRQARARIRG